MGADLYIEDEFEEIREVIVDLSCACGKTQIFFERLLQGERDLPDRTLVITDNHLFDKSNAPFPQDVREWLHAVILKARNLQDFVNPGILFFDHKDIDHFRDPYNATSVLWSFGLSWPTDCGSLADEDGILQGDALKTFLNLIESSQQNMPTMDDLEKSHFIVDENNPLEAYYADIAQRTEELLTFLRRAIENELPVSCSL